MKLIKEKLTLPRAIGVTEKSEELRNKMMIRAGKLAPVRDPKSQASAVDMARDIHTHVKEIRAAGLALRRPLNALVARIKAVEDDHVAPLLLKQEEIERQVSQFQAEEIKRVQKEEQAQRKLLQDKLAAQTQAEATGNGPQVATAALAVREVLAIPLPEPVKAAGASTKRVVRWLITDKAKLFAARPELFSVDIKLSAVAALCFPADGATQAQPDMRTPGLQLWWELETNVRRW